MKIALASGNLRASRSSEAASLKEEDILRTLRVIQCKVVHVCIMVCKAY